MHKPTLGSLQAKSLPAKLTLARAIPLLSDVTDNARARDRNSTRPPVLRWILCQENPILVLILRQALPVPPPPLPTRKHSISITGRTVPFGIDGGLQGRIQDLKEGGARTNLFAQVFHSNCCVP